MDTIGYNWFFFLMSISEFLIIESFLLKNNQFVVSVNRNQVWFNLKKIRKFQPLTILFLGIWNLFIYILRNFSYCIIYVTACNIDIGMLSRNLKVNRFILFPIWIMRIRIFSNIFPMIEYIYMNNIWIKYEWDYMTILIKAIFKFFFLIYSVY